MFIKEVPGVKIHSLDMEALWGREILGKQSPHHGTLSVKIASKYD